LVSVWDVPELQAGLWHWEARHPGWSVGEPWGPEVSSYAIDDGHQLLLFDPLAVPSELVALAADRETALVLTAPWHERDAERLVERLGVPVFTRPPTERPSSAPSPDARTRFAEPAAGNQT
jgi:hypothetical protein